MIGKRFKSPGVYTQEKDVSGWYINNNCMRRSKIIKIFNLDIVRDMYATPYGGGLSFKVNYM